ncbi:hypothetical protein XmelCFBP4644_19830 [Xanthomonas melonis]|uniref:Uncharacterized protein n=1 Tax=Xanthomonas melonis TaxID=56456 RepID=A0A2S7D9S6_9XANT|nr:hypothetical protein XmelCFBP4644_19830 [Xanthomonas melonis]
MRHAHGAVSQRPGACVGPLASVATTSSAAHARHTFYPLLSPGLLNDVELWQAQRIALAPISPSMWSAI